MSAVVVVKAVVTAVKQCTLSSNTKHIVHVDGSCVGGNGGGKGEGGEVRREGGMRRQEGEGYRRERGGEVRRNGGTNK